MARRDQPAERPASRSWRGVVLRVLLGLLGLAAIAWLVDRIGVERLVEAARSVARWLPLIAAIEGARILVDALTTRLLYGAKGRNVPHRELLRAHLIAYPANLLLPGGRAVSEGIKAASLRRFVGIERVVAAGVVAPALALFGVVAISIPALAAALFGWGASAFTGAIALQAFMALVAALGIVLLARRPELGRGMARLSSSLGAATGRVQDELATMGLLPRRALAAAVLNRALLALEVVILSYASGVGGAGLIAAIGVYLVGAAVGDAVPGQLGATDGSFALAAGALGVPLASAVAVSLSIHVVQLAWGAAGALAAVAWRAAPESA